MSKPPSLPTLQTEWFYVLQDHQHGPVTLDELKTLIDSKVIARTTLVWQTEWQDWRKACEAEGLFTQPPPLPTKMPPALNLAPPVLEKRTLSSSQFLILCNECHYVGPPKKKQKGNYFVCIILLMLLVVPGVIYLLWRIFSARIRYCPQCNSEHVIPTHSVAARSKVKEFTESELLQFDKLAMEEKSRIEDELTAQVLLIIGGLIVIALFFIGRH